MDNGVKQSHLEMDTFVKFTDTLATKVNFRFFRKNTNTWQS